MNTSSTFDSKAVSFADALRLHFKFGSDPALIFHCSHVMDVAFQIIKQLPDEININKNLVSLGAFLHDIGRTKTQGIKHGINGFEIITQEFPKDDFSNALANIASRHIGAGIPKEEAKFLGLPFQDFIPITIEEKIVCYSDKLVDYSFNKKNSTFQITKWFTYDSVDNEAKKLSSRLGLNHPAITRLYKLEQELRSYHNSQPFEFSIFKNQPISI